MPCHDAGSVMIKSCHDLCHVTIQELSHISAQSKYLSTVQYSTVQYSTVQYSTVQYSTVQYSTVQYSTVQYSTVYITVQYSVNICDSEIQRSVLVDCTQRQCTLCVCCTAK